MKIIICDDNKLFAHSLVRRVTEIVRNSEYGESDFICDQIYPPDRLIGYAKENHIDILFLDISMPGKSGLDIAEHFFDYYPDTKIIFITSFENYVYRVFKYQPFRFIRKNNIDDELYEAVISACAAVLSDNDKLILKSTNMVRSVRIPRILYAEKENRKNYIDVVTLDGVFKYRGSVAELEMIFSGFDFVKVSSSALINMKFIISIENDVILLPNGKTIFVSRAYIPDVNKSYIEFLRRIR